jgi:hypothetical protein
MSDDSMQWSKRKSTASPFFDSVNRGQSQGRVGAADGPAGGEVRPSDYVGKSHSVHPTRGLGGDTPPKNTRGV